MKREKKLEVLTVEKINTIEEYYQSKEKTICHLTVAGGKYILTLDDISCIKSNEVEKWPIKKIGFDTSKKELSVALVGIDFKNNVEDYYFHFKEDELFFNVHKQYQEIEKQSQMEIEKEKAKQKKEEHFQRQAKKDWKFRLSLLAITACFAAFLALFKMSGQMTTSFLYTAIEWMPFYFVLLWIGTAFHLQRNKRYTKMFALLQIVISTVLLGILYISNQQVALSYVIFFMLLILPSIIYLWKNKKEKLQSEYTLGAKTWGLIFVLVVFGPFLFMQYLPNFKHHQGSSSFVDYSTLYFILIFVLCGYVAGHVKTRALITYVILLLTSSSVLFSQALNFNHVIVQDGIKQQHFVINGIKVNNCDDDQKFSSRRGACQDEIDGHKSYFNGEVLDVTKLPKESEEFEKYKLKIKHKISKDETYVSETIWYAKDKALAPNDTELTFGSIFAQDIENYKSNIYRSSYSNNNIPILKNEKIIEERKVGTRRLVRTGCVDAYGGSVRACLNLIEGDSVVIGGLPDAEFASADSSYVIKTRTEKSVYTFFNDGTYKIEENPNRKN